MITLRCNDVVNEIIHYNYYINRPSVHFAFFFVSLSLIICFFRYLLSLFLHFLAFFSFDSGDKKARHEDSSVAFFPRVVLRRLLLSRSRRQKASCHEDLSGKIRVVFPLYFRSSIFYFNVYFILYVNS